MEDAYLEKKINGLIEKVDHKYYGKYRGKVVDNEDPEKLGRLKLKVPSVFGKDVVTGWAMPCLPYGGAGDQGFFAIPEKEAGVWVEFEGGDLEYPIWVGTYWSKPGGKTGLPDPENDPTSKILKTLQKHSIELKDKENEEHICISEKDGRNKLMMDQQGIEIKDPNKNKINMKSTGVVIESSKIKLGGEGAIQPVVLGYKLIKWLATHTHPTSMGPSGPPAEPPQNFCSDKNYSL